MFRNEIRLDTISDINEFIRLITPFACSITVEDGDGHCVNAKSMLGMMYASGEFSHKYVVSEKDISGVILKFII